MFSVVYSHFWVPSGCMNFLHSQYISNDNTATAIMANTTSTTTTIHPLWMPRPPSPTMTNNCFHHGVSPV